MNKILFDTNIILDWLLEREMFYKASTHCIELCKDEKILSSIIESALWKENIWNDIEDSMQMVSANLNKIDLILTRNPKDFKNSQVKYLSPEEFLFHGK